MFIAIRRERNGAIYLDKNYFNKFSELKYGFSKVEVPNKYIQDITAFDFDNNLMFDEKIYLKNRQKIILDNLRHRRENECFEFINRGVLWYNTLTEDQRLELDKWYKEWLDVTDRYVEGIDIEAIIPKKPEWIK